MKKRTLKTATLSLAILFGVATALFGQDKKSEPPAGDSAAAVPQAAAAEPAIKASQASQSKQPTAEEMQQEMAQMMELSKTGENHKRLADLAGNWNYTVKMWMDPSGKAQESKGTATRKAILDGHFFLAEHSGKFQMPGPDGKMKDMNFKGMAMEGYDNVKKKFVSSWIDNMGTMILSSEGDYDDASKTFTYRANFEWMPGKKVSIREVVKVADKDHHNFEWYEDRGAGEMKTMEIAYTRKK